MTGADVTAVLVTDGDTRPALAATRALGARGLAVHVVASRGGSLAAASRHAAAEHVLPDPERAPATRDVFGVVEFQQFARTLAMPPDDCTSQRSYQGR